MFVQAGTDTNGPLQSWENLYINPNEFGGHIDSSNNIGLGDSATFSEYLFPLSKMNYWKTRVERAKGNLLSADWGVLMNVSQFVKNKKRVWGSWLVLVSVLSYKFIPNKK